MKVLIQYKESQEPIEVFVESEWDLQFMTALRDEVDENEPDYNEYGDTYGH